MHDPLCVGNESARELRARIQRLQDQLHQSTEIRMRLEAQLAHAEQLSLAGSWEGDLRTGRASWSEGVYRIFGLEPNSFVPRHRSFLEFVHPHDRPAAELALDNALAGKGPLDNTLRFVRTDGAERILRCQGTVLFDDERRPQRIYGIARDITEEAHRRASLAQSEQRFRLIAETVEDGFWMSSPNLTQLLYVNPAFERIWGRTQAQFADRPASFLDTVHPDDRPRPEQALQEHRGARWRCDYRIVRPEGEVRWVADRGQAVYDEQRNLIALTGVARDITERVWAQQRLEQALRELRAAKAESERLLLQDPLTGVANRRYLDDFMQREWRRENRESKPISLLFLDIDYFKAFNDFYGHLAGDECLQRIAECLHATLQRPGDLLVRFGGEEFLAVLPGTDAQGARHVAETLHEAVEGLAIPHARSWVSNHVTISIGAVCVDPRMTSPVEAIERSDQALYGAKYRGRNQVFVADISA